MLRKHRLYPKVASSTRCFWLELPTIWQNFPMVAFGSFLWYSLYPKYLDNRDSNYSINSNCSIIQGWTQNGSTQILDGDDTGRTEDTIRSQTTPKDWRHYSVRSALLCCKIDPNSFIQSTGEEQCYCRWNSLWILYRTTSRLRPRLSKL